MSATRHNTSGEFRPERGLSSARLKGVNIGLNIVIKVARAHAEPMRRAMIWLVNYANMRGLTADVLCNEVDLDKGEIRAALTDPDYDSADRFVAKVGALRKRFEATLTAPVATAVTQEVDRAMRFALRKRKMIEVVGKTRMGKSVAARHWWLRNLDRVLWFECPEDSTLRAFYCDLAEALGIGIGSGKKVGQLRAQVRPCFCELGVQVLVVDEGHRLWPSDVRAKPERVEFLRRIYADGRGCSVVVIATPQHTESLNASLDAAGRWAPGQYEGRIVRFHLDDTMSEADLRAVARHYAPEADRAVLDALVEWALASDGYCGAMVEVIDLAREAYLDEGAPLTLKAVTDAQLQQARGTRIARLLATAPKPRA